MDRRGFLQRACGVTAVATCAGLSKSHAIASTISAFDKVVQESAFECFRWLWRNSGDNIYGWNPSLNRPIPGRNLLRSAGAHAALARGVRTFVWETTEDGPWGLASIGEQVRDSVANFVREQTVSAEARVDFLRPLAKGDDCNPVGLAALLLLSLEEATEDPFGHDPRIHDSIPGIARYLAYRQRQDGTFRLGLSDDPADDEGDDDLDEVAYYPGEALYAMARGHRIEKESWRTEVVERAFAPYRNHWRQYRQQAFVPWQSCAYSEMYLATRQRKYADFVFEMNDWLLPLQYSERVGVSKEWIGGFDSVWQGERMNAPPGASTGSYAESLVDAFRVARAVGDKERMEKYEAATIAAFRFLTSIQYTDANTKHFQPELQERLKGAFHASVEDGTVRIDFAQHALMAMCNYLKEVKGDETGEGPVGRRGSRE